jgi:serine/threonine-protein phosphatase 6 regulatory subunit 3
MFLLSSLQIELSCLLSDIKCFYILSTYTLFVCCLVKSSGSLFTNSNWFAFEEDRDRLANERSTSSLASPSPNAEEGVKNVSEDVPAIEDEDLADTASSSPEAEPEAEPKLEPVGTDNKPVEWVEWRESLDASDPSEVLPNGALESESGNNDLDAAEPSPSSDVILTKDGQTDAALLASLDENLSIGSSDPIQTESENPSSPATIPVDGALAEVGDSNKDTTDDKKGIEQMSS